MEGTPIESESWVFSTSPFQDNPDEKTLTEQSRTSSGSSWISQEHEEDWPRLKNEKKKKKNQVLLEAYVEAADEDDLTRTKSLTGEDLDELKGCLDLGFGFSYDEIPELCNTLPALELCYSMSQKFNDDQQKSPENSPAPTTDSCSPVSSPIANWKISSPGQYSLGVCKVFTFSGKTVKISCFCFC